MIEEKMKYNAKIGWFDKLCGGAMFYLCRVLGWLPDCILYGCFAPFVYFVMYRLLHYRISVVRINLENSFPEKTEEELREIERKFYRHLSNVLVDSISFAGISRKKLATRIVYTNLDELREELNGRSWLCALGHYGSWEYFCGFAHFFSGYDMLGVYRPLHNKAFDYFYYNMRRRFGCTPVTMTGLLKSMVQNINAGKQFEVGLICDQTPPFYEIKHWFNFLNQPTPFFEGLERLASKFRLPIYFAHLKKTGKISYEITFERVYDGEEEFSEYELMQRYVEKLELMIRESPELWMWSHRRWKHKPGMEWKRRKSSY